MDEKRLYRIVDFILNQADPQELDVVRAALRRREEGQGEQGTGRGPYTFAGKINDMARGMASQVSNQVGANSDQVRKMVLQFVQELIEKEAPELSREQIQELMDEWIPDQRAEPDSSQSDDTATRSLPSDVLLTMIQHFVSFSTGAMTVSEEMTIKKAMPNWQKAYWGNFSGTIRKLIDLFLKGTIGEMEFWSGVYDELGIDPRSLSSPS